MADFAAVPSSAHAEGHYITRAGWLRATVLGANDGLLSTGSLMVGVAAASVSAAHLILTGVAGIVAGAMSMAAGEYVSVSSQADSESADLAREKKALADNPEAGEVELTDIYIGRGLDPKLASQVAAALSEHDALSAHARDELGISEATSANPAQAAAASALSFFAGGAPPLLVAVLFPAGKALILIPAVTVVVLAVLGALGAHLGGAALGRAAIRVTIFGSLAMAVTGLVGHYFAGAA